MKVVFGTEIPTYTDIELDMNLGNIDGAQQDEDS